MEGKGGVEGDEDGRVLTLEINNKGVSMGSKST